MIVNSDYARYGENEGPNTAVHFGTGGVGNDVGEEEFLPCSKT